MVVHTHADIVTHGMTMNMWNSTQRDKFIVTHGMTICEIVYKRTDLVSQGMTIYDLVHTESCRDL